jgi:hypothetical protein
MAILTPAACSIWHPGLLPWWFHRLAVGTLLLIAAVHSPAQPATAREYQVKAVFLFNFAQFVEWPRSAFPDEKSPLVIGVLGDDPFGPFLDEVVRGESVGGRSLVIQRYRRPEEIVTCHILFIGSSEAARLGQIIARLPSRDVLTVSDIDGSARAGVMICFLAENKKIRLRINLEVARTAHLVISSKLLRSAEIVGSQPEATP